MLVVIGMLVAFVWGAVDLHMMGYSGSLTVLMIAVSAQVVWTVIIRPAKKFLDGSSFGHSTRPGTALWPNGILPPWLENEKKENK